VTKPVKKPVKKKLPTKRQASRQVVAFFERNGYIRRQLEERRAAEGRRYKKGDEVRLTANSEAEVELIQSLLDVLEFTHGSPFVKSRQYRIPIYGREQVRRFVDMVRDQRS